MQYIISENARFGSVEIKFSAKPSEATRDALKALKFRWNGKRGLWYGFATVEAVRAALDGENAQEQTNSNGTDAEPSTGRKAARKTNKPDQDRIRIYYNGIKLDGGKLIKCNYSLNAPNAVTIYADSYGGDLPRDLLPVRNESDSYTDYFEKDSATIGPEHPLYKYFRFAALSARAKDARRYIERCRDRIAHASNYAASAGFYQTEIERSAAQIAEFEAAEDPGQPSRSDLDAIDTQRQEAENARRAAELAEEQKQRERFLCQKNNGAVLIREEMAAHPVKDGEPVVLIRWSEHPAFYDWNDTESLRLSAVAADNILRKLDEDERRTREGGYYKTSFVITWTDENGEKSTYEGRYDLGDGDGGLIAHIRAWGEWQRTHDNFGHEKPEPDETNGYIEFADYLATFCAAQTVPA